MPAVSVLVTTYNKPRDLERVLEGFRGQTDRDLELLVCDDGSGPETAALVQRFAAGAPFPVEHVWQEDLGFRAARSRNNGGRAARGDLLVFADGDCVPFPDLVARHRAAARPGTFLAGERYLLEPEEADRVTVEAIRDGSAFAAAPAREVRRVASIARKDVFYRLTRLKPDRPRLMTANCSVARVDLRAVNGLDERYEGWGQEDEDLRRRLVARGRRCGSVVGAANALHLWHKADPTFLGKRRMSPNWAYYERGFQLSRCRRGLVARALDDLAGRVTAPAGSGPGLAERALAALGLGRHEQGTLEVEVALDPGTGPAPRLSGGAEVGVLLAAGPPDPARVPRGCHVVLAPGVEDAGGELPGEQRPPVRDDLARRGVRATRGVPPGLDAAALAAARGVLDALL